MLMLSTLTILSFLLSALLILATLLISEKSLKEREKMTPFECGFSPYKKARSPFSLRFFMIALIFLIFDMEIALILPMGVLAKNSQMTVWLSTALVVIIVLLGGLLYEWKNGALSWVK